MRRSQLPPQQERVREFDLYMGPKEYGRFPAWGTTPTW
jgi:hypothetical protein